MQQTASQPTTYALGHSDQDSNDSVAKHRSSNPLRANYSNRPDSPRECEFSMWGAAAET
jgi:hypothetical protein